VPSSNTHTHTYSFKRGCYKLKTSSAILTQRSISLHTAWSKKVRPAHIFAFIFEMPDIFWQT